MLGAERYITQNYEMHKTAEDYSGNHLSPIKITGMAKVTRVVNHFKVHEDSINYYDFINNQYKWRDGDYYNCISITGKHIRFHKDELGGNCVEVEGYVDNQYYRCTMFHMASTLVQVGDIVTSDTILGYQGNTGLVDSSKSRDDITYGTHVHLEVKNNFNQFINPREFALGNKVLTFEEQTNALDTSVDQILIVVDQINIREYPTVDSKDIGDVYNGEIYTILGMQDDILYTWYKIKTNRGLVGFVASSKEEEWVEVKKGNIQTPPKEEPEEVPPKDIKEYILLFTCPKTDTYYLKLQEGEQLYLLKQD